MRGRLITASGGKFDLCDPRAEDVRLLDIAQSLANQCRYGGHTRGHYSVAEHCVRVAGYLHGQGYSEEVQRVGLLHDAEEAYLRDLPAPFLDILPEAERLAIERAGLRVRCAVFQALGVPVQLAFYETFLPEVAEVDGRIRADEIAALFPESCAWAREGVEPLGIFEPGHQPWGPAKALEYFVDEARRLELCA